MRAVAIAFGIVASALVVPSSSGAQTPRRVEDIPLYTGAVRDQAGESKALAEQQGESGQGMQRPQVDLRQYRAPVSVEKVVAFYRDKLGAAPRDGAAYEQLTAGQISEVSLMLGMHQASCDWGVSEQALRAHRPPDQDGEWIRRATIQWAVGRDKGNVTTFTLEIEDVGFTYEPLAESRCKNASAYRPATQMTLTASTELMNAEAIAEQTAMAEKDAEESAEAGKAAGLRRFPPTEANAGAPFYPGAAFNEKASLDFWPEEEHGRVYVFLTNDPIAKVAAFYAQRTGKTAVVQPDNSHHFILEGEVRDPMHSIVVVANRFVPDSPAPTVIVIGRRTPPR